MAIMVYSPLIWIYIIDRITPRIPASKQRRSSTGGYLCGVPGQSLGFRAWGFLNPQK